MRRCPLRFTFTRFPFLSLSLSLLFSLSVTMCMGFHEITDVYELVEISEGCSLATAGAVPPKQQ